MQENKVKVVKIEFSENESEATVHFRYVGENGRTLDISETVVGGDVQSRIYGRIVTRAASQAWTFLEIVAGGIVQLKNL